MPDLTYSAEDLRELAEEALENNNFDTALALAANASDTEKEAEGDE